MDLKSLSYVELQDITKEIEHELKSRKSRILSEAKNEIFSIAKKHGLTIEEILAGKSATKVAGTKSVAPKYRNPNNTEETWTGRGKKPSWVITALSEGTSLDQLKI